jgi:hypothetical protein
VSRVLAVARNGQRVVLGGGPMMLVEVPSGRCQQVWGEPTANAEPAVVRIARPANVRQRFEALGVLDDQRLALITYKREQAVFILDRERKHLYLVPTADSTRPTWRRCGFKDAARPMDVGCRLQVATWDDGSRAFLDSRGMLHLKSSDRSIPELTIILHDGVVAGWCSAGRVFGNEYFIDGRPNVTPVEIYEQILEPFVARLR